MVADQRSRPPESSPVIGFRIRGLDVLASAVIAAVPIGIGLYVLEYTELVRSASDVSASTIWSAIYCLALLGAIWLVFVRHRRASFAALGWTQIKGQLKLGAAALGGIPLVVVWAALYVMRDSAGAVGHGAYGLRADTTPLQFLTLAAFVGIIGPIAEEMFFRGVLFGWMRQRVSFWPAAIGSSILFGAAHIEPASIAIAAIAGVAFAGLYERTGSLLMPAMAHQAWNFTLVTAIWLSEILDP